MIYRKGFSSRTRHYKLDYIIRSDLFVLISDYNFVAKDILCDMYYYVRLYERITYYLNSTRVIID